MRLLLPFLTAFSIEFVVRVWITVYYKPWRTNPELAAEKVLPSGDDSEWIEHIYPMMNWIRQSYQIGMCGIFLVNIRNIVGHIRVGGISLLNWFGVLILFIVFAVIGYVIYHLSRAIKGQIANGHEKVMVALYYS